MTQKQKIAFHEAAHFLLCWYCCSDVLDVKVRRTSGAVYRIIPTNGTIEADIMISLAGPLIDLEFHSEYCKVDLWFAILCSSCNTIDDAANIKRLLDFCKFSKKKEWRVLEDLTNDTRKILSEYRPQIKQIAALFYRNSGCKQRTVYRLFRVLGTPPRKNIGKIPIFPFMLEKAKETVFQKQQQYTIGGF